MADVSLRGVKKQFGALSVIKGVDLDVKDGEFCVFVGPSGCGKSTLLRMIAGLEEITSGGLTIGGKDMTRIGPSERGVAMVFQSYALYPHMTVRDNIGFGLKMTGHPKPMIEARTKKAAELLQLDALMERKPGQLSGGQRQRVAIGRAIVREPEVFLFDEPLSNLDAALRVQMRTELSKLHQDLKATMIYVTHDQVEAMTMADKIVVLSAGLIEQVGTPLELYHRPNNLFVAGFIGSPKMNVLPVTVAPADGGKVVVTLADGAAITLDAQGKAISPGKMTLGIRPEHIDATGKGDLVLSRPVRLAEYLGSETLFFVTLADGTELSVKADGLATAKPGETLSIGIPAAACHLFDEAGKAVINGDLTR
ncbi:MULTISPECIES: ABC transporter ATP-binding protein [Rhizobium/Agrobacterium group]|uniref:ABC transporter ATP-binding protein n=1 Tax=Rhizobium/Agrobacterium group TaxID=227290 RepID=UPI000872B75E|nr:MULTISPECIES: sn-glycerol-3-phosphate ABC transporter ATP-binding protein UgpC [Rhizobium/Agrobacterium group]MCE6075552.1 sn-glycerol-3-phosphate ABC transporter ATP-binding protein UgpC [Agrobacterium vitis]MCF1433033.1 sn-glycerol-3-phosphate ABC transporter ATP-binding protein UgpC [Allorhizobium ampelinum]MCM2451687.1 sn-glycerol-3-phosphate ABC transporter ATP-binding protein UgpC [Agrobacterium vitis]MCM2468030.1 sn-glycerol-3-phosphate ABC transporter ATP-binding protein UgpC [Agroba